MLHVCNRQELYTTGDTFESCERKLLEKNECSLRGELE